MKSPIVKKKESFMPIRRNVIEKMEKLGLSQTKPIKNLDEIFHEAEEKAKQENQKDDLENYVEEREQKEPGLKARIRTGFVELPKCPTCQQTENNICSDGFHLKEKSPKKKTFAQKMAEAKAKKKQNVALSDTNK